MCPSPPVVGPVCPPSLLAARRERAAEPSVAPPWEREVVKEGTVQGGVVHSLLLLCLMTGSQALQLPTELALWVMCECVCVMCVRSQYRHRLSHHPPWSVSLSHVFSVPLPPAHSAPAAAAGGRPPAQPP